MKKSLLVTFLFVQIICHTLYSQVGIGTTNPDTSAILDLSSLERGFLVPRMSYAKRNLIQNPSKGLLVFQNNTGGIPLEQQGFYFYDGALWKRLARADETGIGGNNSWTVFGDHQYSNLVGNVGIGTMSPTSKLHLSGSLLTENGSVTINQPAAILQLQSGGVNKGFLQLSGNNVRVGTNSGNTSGEFIVRMNGQARMVIDSTGEVGIGTETPETKLDIVGGLIQLAYPGSTLGFPHAPILRFVMTHEDGKKGGLRFFRDGNTLSDALYHVDETNPNYFNFSMDGSSRHDLLVNSLGRVGINMNGETFNPVGQLHVRNQSGTDAIAFHSSDGSAATLQFYNTTLLSDPQDKKAFIQLNNTEDLRLGTNSGNNTGKVIFRMNGSNAVTIDPAGNMGIGADAPITRLHIDGGVEASLSLPGFMTIGDISGLNVAFDNNEIIARDNGASSTLTLQHEGGPLRVGSDHKLFVNTSGNIGIGTSNPLAKLDVRGRIRIDQDGEALGIDGANPFIGLWHNGSYKFFIQQLGNDLQIGKTGGNPTGRLFIGAQQIAINTPTPAVGYSLSVGGKVICEELRVELAADWPDYVFEPEYRLRSLRELEAYIRSHKHLPGIPDASTMHSQGLDVGEMNRLMVEKIEELTLYVIELQRQIDELKQRQQ